MSRLPGAQLLVLILCPLVTLGLAGYASWSPGSGPLLSAVLAAGAGAAAVAACVFAFDAARIRRAFAHLRAGGAGLGYELPARQQAREERQHQLVARLRRQVEQLSAIRDLALIANDDVDFARILERALVVLGGFLDAREITIFQLEGPELEPVPVARRVGEKVRVRTDRPLKATPDVAREALDERRSIVRKVRGGGLRAATLLVAEGELMGALELRLGRGGFPWEPLELVRELEGLAKPIALAIRKPTLYDRAVVDGLTRLYTKRHFQEQVQQHMAQGKRLGTPLSLIILDVDHFKSVNDTHGHVAGDVVLAEVARRTRAAIRAYDQAFRYGGEEVVILAPNTGLTDAVGLAERLRQTMRGSAIDTGETRITITASFGVAEFDPAAMPDLAAFVEAADQHLYRAKHGGRDRVESALSAPAEAEDAQPTQPDERESARGLELAA